MHYAFFVAVGDALQNFLQNNFNLFVFIELALKRLPKGASRKVFQDQIDRIFTFIDLEKLNSVIILSKSLHHIYFIPE
jgi:hypothetical protein